MYCNTAGEASHCCFRAEQQCDRGDGQHCHCIVWGFPLGKSKLMV